MWDIIWMIDFSILAGLIFSMIGAAGGLISSFFLMNFANLSSVNDVKVMTLVLVLSSAAVSVPKYVKAKRILWPIGMLLGTGGILGSMAGSYISSKYLDNPKTFLPLFAAFTLFVAAYITYKTLKSKNKKNTSKEVDLDYSVKSLKINFKHISFELAGKQYKIKTYLPVLGGFAIAFIASMLGVGGGFMLVPFVSAFMNIPMYVVPATVAVAIAISLVMSIASYLSLGASLDWALLAMLVPGIVIGSLIGPVLNKKLKLFWLNILTAIVLFVISIKYIIQLYF